MTVRGWCYAKRMRERLAGIFVGGAGRRMGGTAKGLLRAPTGEAIAERLVATFDALGVPVVLVGDARAYAHLGREAIADEPAGIGPLGGLVAALRRAGGAQLIAIACDMPYVSRALVARLVESAVDAPVIAARRDGRWEPFFARYDAWRVLPIAIVRAATADRSLQSLLDDASATELLIAPDEADELRDWDTPDDVT